MPKLSIKGSYIIQKNKEY